MSKDVAMRVIREMSCPRCGAKVYIGELVETEDRLCVAHKMPTCKSYNDLDALEFLEICTNELN